MGGGRGLPGEMGEMGEMGLGPRMDAGLDMVKLLEGEAGLGEVREVRLVNEEDGLGEGREV